MITLVQIDIQTSRKCHSSLSFILGLQGQRLRSPGRVYVWPQIRFQMITHHWIDEL